MASLRCVGFLFCVLVLGCGRDAPAPGTPASHSPAARSSDQKVAYATNAYRKVQARVDELTQQVTRDPDNARLRFELGSTLLVGGIQQRGLDELKKALEIDPGHAQAAVLVCRTELQMGDLDGTESTLRSALARRETAELKVIEGELALRRDPDAIEAAGRSIARALELDPHNIEGLYQKGLLAIRNEQPGTAEVALREVIRRVPSHLGAHFNLAKLLRALGRDGEATEIAAAHKRLAILETLGQLDDPFSIEAYAGVAQVLDNGGDVDGECDELDRGIAKYPDSAILRVKKALALLTSGRTDEGRKAFEVAIRALPSDAMVANQFAWYLASKPLSDDDRRRAVKLAEKAVSLTGRKDSNMLDTLAEARLAAGDRVGAKAALEEALKLSPNDPVLLRKKQDMAKRAEGAR